MGREIRNRHTLETQGRKWIERGGGEHRAKKRALMTQEWGTQPKKKRSRGRGVFLMGSKTTLAGGEGGGECSGY